LTYAAPWSMNEGRGAQAAMTKLASPDPDRWFRRLGRLKRYLVEVAILLLTVIALVKLLRVEAGL
jgi:hypothetical protein